LKLIDPSRATVVKGKLGSTEYDFLQTKVVCVGQYTGSNQVAIQSNADLTLNQEVWIAIKKHGEGTNPEEYWNDLAEPLTKQMPPWHMKNGPEAKLPITVDGTVQIPDIPFKIEAGEHLGYLGKYEFLKNAQGNIDQEYRVHLEVFSNDRPPEYFLKALAGGQEEHGFQVIDGSGSTGVMEPANAFFNDIRRAIDTDNDGQISENELVAFYQAATNRLEKVIAKHPSEWYFKAEEHWFNQVLAMSQKLTEASLSRYFDSTESYMSSEFRNNFVQSYDSFAIHEKERIDNTSWMQDINPEKLELKPEVWHFWPLGVTSLLDDEMDVRWLNVTIGQLTFNAEGNDRNDSIYFSRVIHWPGGVSGVTIGRGYDLGTRTEQSVFSDLTNVGINNEVAREISRGAGIIGSAARDFVQQNRNNIGEITRKQQYMLFDMIFPRYVDRAQRNYDRWTERYTDRVEWEQLDAAIKDVLIDFVYQGFTQGENPMIHGMRNDRQVLINYIETNQTMRSYEEGRHRADYLRNN
ncbi:hypothetical protein Q4579_06300, partial [Photobacterium sp. 1_MG-2023]|nr:hypothetical protein [Photobacterium sp. 1_MG-2023]